MQGTENALTGKLNIDWKVTESKLSSVERIRITANVDIRHLIHMSAW
jgi:hypothetical protein